MRKSIARGENLVTGEVTEFTKFKEDSNVRGIAFIELTEGDKTVYRSEAENLFIDYNEWNAWACSHNDMGGFSHGNNPRMVRPFELHLLYDKDNKEDARLHPRERVNGTVTDFGEGEIIGYADIRGNYSGNDNRRGSRSQALSYSFLDPKTSEMVYRYGFIFDETKLVGKKINKLAILPRYHCLASNSNSDLASYNSFVSQRADEDTADQMEMRFTGFPRVSDTWQRIDNRQLHGDILFNTPDDYKSRGNYAVMWSDTKKVNSAGYIAYTDAIELVLGDLDPTDRNNGFFNYRDSSRCLFNPKTRKIYYVSPVVSGQKAFISFGIAEFDVAQVEKDGFPSKRLTPTWTKYYDIPTNLGVNTGRVNPKFFVPYFNWDKNVVEVIYNANVTGHWVNIRLNTDWTLRDFRQLPFNGQIHHVDRINDDFYRVSIRRAYSDNTLNWYDESYKSYIFTYVDFAKKQNFLGDMIWASSGGSIYMMFNDTLTGSLFTYVSNNTGNSSRLRMYVPAPIVQRPIEYLYVDRIPEVPKTSLQQLKIVYEIRQKVVPTTDPAGIVTSRPDSNRSYTVDFYKADTSVLDNKGFFKVLMPDLEREDGALVIPNKDLVNRTKPYILPVKDKLGSTLRLYRDGSYNYHNRLYLHKEEGFGTASESIETSDQFTPPYDNEVIDSEAMVICSDDLRTEISIFSGSTERNPGEWFDIPRDMRFSYIPSKNLPDRITDVPIKVMVRTKGMQGDGLPLLWFKPKFLAPIEKPYTFTHLDFMTWEVTGTNAIRVKVNPETRRTLPYVLFGQSQSTSTPMLMEKVIALDAAKTFEVSFEIKTDDPPSSGYVKFKIDDEVLLTVDSSNNKLQTLTITKRFVNKASFKLVIEASNRWSGYTERYTIGICGITITEVPAR